MRLKFLALVVIIGSFDRRRVPMGLANPSHVSTEVNEFVAKIYPKGESLFLDNQ